MTIIRCVLVINDVLEAIWPSAIAVTLVLSVFVITGEVLLAIWLSEFAMKNEHFPLARNEPTSIALYHC